MATAALFGLGLLSDHLGEHVTVPSSHTFTRTLPMLTRSEQVGLRSIVRTVIQSTAFFLLLSQLILVKTDFNLHNWTYGTAQRDMSRHAVMAQPRYRPLTSPSSSFAPGALAWERNPAQRSREVTAKNSLVGSAEGWHDGGTHRRALGMD